MGFDQFIVDIINRVSASKGVPADLALAVAQVESGGNPLRIGDSGHSVGLYQLNDAGEGAGMTTLARQDPARNAGIALGVLGGIIKANPGMDPGAQAAKAQRPLDPVGYAAKVDAAKKAIDTQGVAAGTSAPPPGLYTTPVPDAPTNAVAQVITDAGHAFLNGLIGADRNSWNAFKDHALAIAVAAVMIYVLIPGVVDSATGAVKTVGKTAGKVAATGALVA